MSRFYYSKEIQKTIEGVESEICTIFHINPSVFENRGRAPRYSHARFAAWYLLHKRERIPAMEIANAYGYDHTTVLNGILRAIELGIPESIVGQAVNKTRKSGDKALISGDKKSGQAVGKNGP